MTKKNNKKNLNGNKITIVTYYLHYIQICRFILLFNFQFWGHLYSIFTHCFKWFEACDSPHPNLAASPSSLCSQAQSEELAKFCRAPQIFKANISQSRRPGPSPAHLTTGANTLHFEQININMFCTIFGPTQD